MTNNCDLTEGSEQHVVKEERKVDERERDGVVRHHV